MSFSSTLLAAMALLSSTLVRADSQPVNLCGQFDFYNSTTTPFMFNNNAWGNNSDLAKGYQCLDVLQGGRDMSVTYKWTGDASVVKGYPYMKAHPSNLPVPLQNISRLNFAGNWTTYVTSTQNDSPVQQAQAFDTTALRANVAIDMFLSDNATNSTGLGPPIEIMIWPWWTPTVKPLGWGESTPGIDTVMVDGTNFSLYHGWNAANQHVFSWLAQKNITSTNADYSPLLKYIWRKGLLSGALWVGQLEFGTEIMYAGAETKFEANNITLRFVRQGDADDITTTSTTAQPTSTSSSTRTSGVQPVTTTASATVNTTATTRSTSVSSAQRVLADGGFLLAMISFLYRLV